METREFVLPTPTFSANSRFQRLQRQSEANPSSAPWNSFRVLNDDSPERGAYGHDALRIDERLELVDAQVVAQRDSDSRRENRDAQSSAAKPRVPQEGPGPLEIGRGRDDSQPVCTPGSERMPESGSPRLAVVERPWEHAESIAIARPQPCCRQARSTRTPTPAYDRRPASYPASRIRRCGLRRSRPSRRKGCSCPAPRERPPDFGWAVLGPVVASAGNWFPLPHHNSHSPRASTRLVNGCQ